MLLFKEALDGRRLIPVRAHCCPSMHPLMCKPEPLQPSQCSASKQRIALPRVTLAVPRLHCVAVHQRLTEAAYVLNWLHPRQYLGASFIYRCCAHSSPQGHCALTIRPSRRLRRGLTQALVPSPALCRPLFIPGFCLSQRFLLWGLGRSPGFACWLGVSFQPFWPLALASQAPAAIILAALRRFRGPAPFRGLRPSAKPGAPFWPSGLTRRSSRPAYGGRLALAVSNTS